MEIVNSNHHIDKMLPFSNQSQIPIGNFKENNQQQSNIKNNNNQYKLSPPLQSNLTHLNQNDLHYYPNFQQQQQQHYLLQNQFHQSFYNQNNQPQLQFSIPTNVNNNTRQPSPNLFYNNSINNSNSNSFSLDNDSSLLSSNVNSPVVPPSSNFTVTPLQYSTPSSPLSIGKLAINPFSPTNIYPLTNNNVIQSPNLSSDNSPISNHGVNTTTTTTTTTTTSSPSYEIVNPLSPSLKNEDNNQPTISFSSTLGVPSLSVASNDENMEYIRKKLSKGFYGMVFNLLPLCEEIDKLRGATKEKNDKMSELHEKVNLVIKKIYKEKKNKLPFPAKTTEKKEYIDLRPRRKRKINVKYKENDEDIQCQRCGVTESPEWRKGPDGCKSLCNACGLYYAKAKRKEKESALNQIQMLAKTNSANASSSTGNIINIHNLINNSGNNVPSFIIDENNNNNINNLYHHESGSSGGSSSEESE